MTALGLVAAVICLGALAGVVNVLAWLVMYRRRPDRPWNWRAVVSMSAYQAWIAGLAGMDGQIADRPASPAEICEPVTPDSLSARRRAIEQIVTASFTAGYDIATGGKGITIEPIICWDADKPLITGYRKAS